MKEFLYKIGLYILFILCTILCTPILILALIGYYLFFVPFEIISYHKMPYYKDLGIKYSNFITTSNAVKTYNRIVREQLPFEYVKNNDFEYFVKDGQVFLCTWIKEDFEQTDGEWFGVFGSNGKPKNKLQISMSETIEDEINLLKSEHKCLPAKFLIFCNDITDAEKFEQAKECPYFHCVFSVDEDI